MITVKTVKLKIERPSFKFLLKSQPTTITKPIIAYFRPGCTLVRLKVKTLPLASKSLEQRNRFLYINARRWHRLHNQKQYCFLRKAKLWLIGIPKLFFTRQNNPLAPSFSTRFRLIAPNSIGANPSSLKRDGFLFFWQRTLI